MTSKHQMESVFNSDLLNYKIESYGAGDGLRTANGCLLELPWEHIWFEWILSRLTIKELFLFRSISKLACQMVQEFFKYNFRLDLSLVGPRFTSDAFNTITSDCELLRVLILRNTKDWLHDNILIPVLANNPQLVRIDFTGCNGISNAALQVLATNCPELTDLCLANCHWVSREGVLSVCIQCQQLERLNLTGCWDICDDVVVTLVMICKNLVFLNLGNIYGLTDEAVKAVARSCSKLRQLSLKGCWRVTDTSIRILAEYCHNLQGLQVRECRNITEKSLKLVRDKKIKVDIPAKFNNQRCALVKLNLQI